GAVAERRTAESPRRRSGAAARCRPASTGRYRGRSPDRSLRPGRTAPHSDPARRQACHAVGGLAAGHGAEERRPPRVTRFKLTIEYDGGPFVGWQRQGNGPTIQQALEDAVARITGETAEVHGAGRTD